MEFGVLSPLAFQLNLQERFTVFLRENTVKYRKTLPFYLYTDNENTFIYQKYQKGVSKKHYHLSVWFFGTIHFIWPEGRFNN